LNVFYLNRDPVIAAQMSCNKHVVKMILESAQLLSTAHRVLDGDDYADLAGMYKLTHKNHPTNIWVRESDKHYDWVYSHMIGLMQEYTYRYDKHHATERLEFALSNCPDNIPVGDYRDPPQCMPDNCKGDDTVLAYQTYYIVEKSGFAQWKRRRQPEWFNEDSKRILLGLHGKKIA